MGEASLAECRVWNKVASAATGDASPVPDADGVRLPWSGAALGTSDLAFLTARSEPKIVGVIGPHNAGKTTLLGLIYQQIGRSGRVGASRFAGSYSLEGWEAIAHALRWEAGVPHFPPHTSSGSGRAPGLLHLALRDGQTRLSDVLFADSPGEWFQRWAVEPTAADAEGARWLIDRASSILIAVDCEALAGPGRGQARSDAIALIRRVAAARAGRLVALVWTKADKIVPEPIRKAVSDAAFLVMPDIVTFETSVVEFDSGGEKIQPVACVKSILEWMVTRPVPGFQVTGPRPVGTDPFFAIGAAA
jgi:hypothetical protein